MTHTQFLIRQAEAHWYAGRELSRSTVATMVSMGINVDFEHRMFNLTMQDLH